MHERNLKTFSYHCACGYDIKVFIDAGLPQERLRCRRCGFTIERSEG